MQACRVPGLLLCLLSAYVGGEEGVLRIGISATHSEPNLIRRDGKISGINPELAQALGEILQRRVELQLLPRKRLASALQAGEIDGICPINPERLDLPGVEFRWTPLLLWDVEVIVGLPTSPPIRKLEDLYGKTIGTTLGYHYPLLEADFRAGRIRRDDAPNETLNLVKMKEGRFNYLVWKETAVYWYNKNNADGPRLQISPLLVERASSQCVFTVQSGLSEAKLAEAVRQMEVSGTLRAILQRYR